MAAEKRSSWTYLLPFLVSSPFPDIHVFLNPDCSEEDDGIHSLPFLNTPAASGLPTHLQTLLWTGRALGPMECK